MIADQLIGPPTIPADALPAAPELARGQLTRRIEAALESSRVIIVTAPAGWGKTSLLAAWAHATERRVAWVSGREGADDAVAFLRALTAALARIGIEPGGDLLALLRSPRPMPTDLILSHVEGLVAGVPDLTVVLDDFHLISSDELQQGLFDLAVNGSEPVRVLVAGREAPSWPLARLRAHGALVEFEARDLAFDGDEIAALMRNLPASPEMVQELAERSEGWPAGLRLARLWYEQGGETTDVPAAFRGTHRDIADYLTEEVIAGLPVPVVDFLLATSMLDAFTASLAADVMGEVGAEALIDEIERRQLFLIPLDDERVWYRYHSVFQDFLRGRLRRVDPDREQKVLRRASIWHERHGTLVEAAQCAKRSGDEDRAAGLLAQVAEHLVLRQGEAQTLIRLAEDLGDGVLAQHPDLEQFHAWALVLAGRLDEAAGLADRAEVALERRDSVAGRYRQAEIAGIRARIAAYRRDHDATIREARTALELASPDFDWFRADALLSLGFAYRSIGRIDEAVEAFADAARIGWRCRFVQAALWGTRYLAVTYISQGRLRDAADLIDEGLERAAQAGIAEGAPMAALLTARGEIRYERHDLAGAREDLERALDLARSSGDAKILMNVYLALSLVDDASGRPDEARDAARRAVRVFDGTGERAHEAWIALRHGDLGAVRAWQAAYMAACGPDPDLCAGEMEQVMLGRSLLVTEPERAPAFLQTLLTQAEESGRWGRAMAIHVLLALAADASGDQDRASGHIMSAVDLGEREGFVRSILDEGPGVRELLRRAARREDAELRREYIAELLLASRAPAESVPDIVGSRPPSGLLEPLTERQLEVLRLMVDGKTNREIASALFVTEGTVKAHAHQIFGKLMARNRAEAIGAARRFGIVGS